MRRAKPLGAYPPRDDGNRDFEGHWQHMDAPWRIQLLGALRADLGGQAVTHFRTQKTALLLARLALFPRRAHSREELIDVLWPDADLDSGRNRLRVAIAALRRQLEPPGVPAGSVLTADRSVVRLNPAAFHCDVADFESAMAQGALEHAWRLYHGELLPGFYDDWVLEERARLESLHEDLCRRRARAPSRASPEKPTAPTVAPLEGAARLLGVPLEFTRFFGRERECAEVSGLLQSPGLRLLTLSGPGGSGKTRLSGEVARRMAGVLAGPVCFVPLADLPDAAAIPLAVADCLGLPRSTDGDPLGQVVAALADLPPALLVLDNFEHLVERGASLVLSLLTRLPLLTCLVTSRRRLKLPGEREYPVPPLPLPEEGAPADQVAAAASVQLFVDRARAARPDFELSRGNAASVAALCRRLEGMPLALELVAARSQALTPSQIVERLERRSDLLSASRATGEKRHRSLWAAISWSYELIPPPLQRFFVRLSVFRGGCTAEAAQAVCEEPQALECLTQLRERSLLVVEEAATGLRFRLLETLREFAGERLSPPERRDLSRRHAAYLESLAVSLGATPCGPARDRALEILDAENDNLRVALDFCRDDPPDDSPVGGWDGSAVGLRLAARLGDYWTTRGLLREGLEWLQGALERGGGGPDRARALSEAGWLAAGLGAYESAEAALTEALALSRDAGDHPAVALALRRRGTVALWRTDNPMAAVDLEEALVVSRATGDEFAVAYALNCLGVLAEQWREDRAEARGLYQEALTLFRRCGDRQRASYCLHNLGNIAHDFGDQELSEALLRESLALAEALGDHWHRAYCLRSLGDVAKARGDLVGAARTLAEGRELCRRLGDRMTEAGTVCSLASVAWRGGDPERARALYEAALGLYQCLAHDVGIAICLVSLAEVAVSQGQAERAMRLLADPAICQEAIASGALRARFEQVSEAARSTLGPEASATRIAE